jgi:hypothetical protein
MSAERPIEPPNFPQAIQHLLEQESASYTEFTAGRADAWTKLAARTALLAPLAAEATRQLVHTHPQPAANDGPRGVVSAPPAPAAAGALARGVSAKVAALMVAAGVAAGAAGFAAVGPLVSGRAISAALSTIAGPAPSMQTTPTSPAAPELPIAASVRASSPEIVASSVTPPATHAPAATANASATASVHATDTLTRERELIDTMRSGITNGRPADALAIGQEHARTFPYGALVEEREVLAITALVRLGRFPEARIRAARFKREHPQSFLRPPPVPEAP